MCIFGCDCRGGSASKRAVAASRDRECSSFWPSTVPRSFRLYRSIVKCRGIQSCSSSVPKEDHQATCLLPPSLPRLTQQQILPCTILQMFVLTQRGGLPMITLFTTPLHSSYRLPSLIPLAAGRLWEKTMKSAAVPWTLWTWITSSRTAFIATWGDARLLRWEKLSWIIQSASIPAW